MRATLSSCTQQKYHTCCVSFFFQMAQCQSAELIEKTKRNQQQKKTKRNQINNKVKEMSHNTCALALFIAIVIIDSENIHSSFFSNVLFQRLLHSYYTFWYVWQWSMRMAVNVLYMGIGERKRGSPSHLNKVARTIFTQATHFCTANHSDT